MALPVTQARDCRATLDSSLNHDQVASYVALALDHGEEVDRSRSPLGDCSLRIYTHAVWCILLGSSRNTLFSLSLSGRAYSLEILRSCHMPF